MILGLTSVPKVTLSTSK